MSGSSCRQFAVSYTKLTFVSYSFYTGPAEWRHTDQRYDSKGDPYIVKKQLAALGLTVGLAGGSIAGFALSSSSGIAGASSSAGATTTTVAGSTQAPTAAPDPSTRLTTVLAPLVKDGTLTQAQADKVIAALKAAGPMGGPGGHGGHGGPAGPGGGMRGGPGLDAAAKALGVTADELRTSLQSGKSIADVAKEKGVEVQKVIDAMVADLKTHLAEEVSAGTHTQAEADQKLADAQTRITAQVNGQMPAGGPRGNKGANPSTSAAETTTTTAA
jgi:hypothetical protein